MDGRVKGEKSLRRPHALETLHLAFSSPGRLMRIFRPFVAPSSGVMPTLDPEITCSGAVRPQFVRDHCLWQKAIFLQELAHQFQRCGLIPLGLDQHVQNLSFTINGSPEIDQASIALQIGFVEMPYSVRLRPAFAKICRDCGSKMLDPATHGFVGDQDSAFRQQIFNVAEAQAEILHIARSPVE